MKAIKRMKEIQKIQRLFHQNSSDTAARTRAWNPQIRLIHWATGPFLNFKAWNATEESGNSPAGVQES